MSQFDSYRWFHLSRIRGKKKQLTLYFGIIYSLRYVQIVQIQGWEEGCNQKMSFERIFFLEITRMLRFRWV